MLSFLRNIINKKNTLLLYIAFATVQLIFMFYQCGKQSMWLDEMSLLGTITKDKSLADILWQYLAVDVTNLPLFPLAAALWYRIFPANDRLMLLLPGIFTAAALIVTALIAERCFGKKSGVVSAILMLISVRCAVNCGFELRAYAFMLFFAGITLYFHFEKDALPDKKNLLLYSISILLLLYTHYLGAIFIAVLALSDLKKAVSDKDIRSILPYLGAGVLFLPWFVLMLYYKEKSIGSFWKSPPTIPEIARTYKYLLSNNEPVFVLFLIGVLTALVRVLYAFLNKEKTDKKARISLKMAAVSFIVILIVFVYSAYINPGGGFYLKRYFIVLLPAVVSVTAYAFTEITEFLFKNRDKEEKTCAFLVLSGFLLIYFGFINLMEIRETSGTSWETFREAAAYVREQGIFDDNEDTVLVCSVNPRATAGFAEYYVRRGGREKEIDTVSLQGDDPLKQLSKYDKLYLVYVHRDLEDLDSGITEALRRDFKLVSENEDVKAAVYERR